VRHRGSAVVGWTFFVIALVACGFMALLGIEPLKQQLHATQALLAEANRSIATLQRQVSLLSASRGTLQEERDGLAQQVARQERMQADLQAVHDQLLAAFTVDIDRGNIAVRRRETELVLDVASDLLFAAGDDGLSEGGKLIVRKAAAPLALLKAYSLEVGGHTDSQLPSAKLVHHFTDNWQLSCARAAAVVRYLQGDCEVAGTHLTAAGYAATRPVAENAHAPGRRRNQRIEFVLHAVSAPQGEGADAPDAP
jgi:chemotaxis protein MotB